MRAYERRLPHWDTVGQAPFVTFRLHGSLPANRVFPPERPAISEPARPQPEAHPVIIACSMTRPANRFHLTIGLVFISFSMPTQAQDRSEARSMVISRHGIVATSQTLASQAGAQILARGGSAMDAAIAANAALGVVEPMSNGIGGDLFAMYWEAKTGRLTGINASGWAPKALSIEFLKAKNIITMPQDGIQSVTVPGCVEGWAKLHGKFGRVPWADLF